MTDQPERSVVVNFSSEYSDVVLLDVSDEELRNAITQPGSGLMFKGKADVVLCSKKSTFALFSRETSNDLYLLEGDLIKGSGAHKYLEPVRIRPRLVKLRELLNEVALTQDELDSELIGRDISGDDDDQRDELKTKKLKTGIHMSELLQEIQGSEQEIRTALIEMGAFENDNGFRILSRELEEKVAVQLVLEINARFGKGESITMAKDVVVTSLSEFNSNVVEAIHLRFFDAMNELKVDALALFFAESMLLKNNKMRMDDFTSTLISSMPVAANMANIEKLVKRIAIFDEDQGTIMHLAFDHLPSEPKKRAEVLFSKRAFWLPQDLEAAFLGVDGGVSEAIQKYARVWTDGSGRRGFIKR